MTTFDDKLAELRERFVLRCSEWIDALEAGLRAGEADPVVAVAHQIAGGAGIFGFPEISTAAAELEMAAAKGNDAQAKACGSRLIGMLRDVSSGGVK